MLTTFRIADRMLIKISYSLSLEVDLSIQESE